MIDRNLGNLERLVRLLLGLLIISWTFTSSSFSLTELFVAGIGLMLLLNGLFSRCYVWYLLDLNTASNPDDDCAST